MTNDGDTGIFTTKELTLSKYNFAIRECIPIGLFDTNFTTEYDPYINAMVAKFNASLWVEQRVKHFISEFSYPKDWWQHWKQQYAPKWFIHKWPVQMQTLKRAYDIEDILGYPNYPAFVSNQRELRITKLTNTVPLHGASADDSCTNLDVDNMYRKHSTI